MGPSNDVRAHVIVAVTGASGFVGRTVTERLATEGVTVRPLSRTSGRSPLGEPYRVQPPFDAARDAFVDAIEGATHLVHCAALNNTTGNISDSAYYDANVRLTERLCEVASTELPGRFVLMSSVRALVGAEFSGIVDERSTPAPTCAYGRSKYAGELAAEAVYGRAGRHTDLVVLRPTGIYGSGMKGALLTLLRLAATPYPLPFAGIRARRSFVSLTSTVEAVRLILEKPDLRQHHFIVANQGASTIAEVVAAFRSGLDRPARLLRVPGWLLEVVAAITGHGEAIRAYSATQLCDPSALVSEGWQAETDTLASLADLARDMLAEKSETTRPS